jgi:arylsulfatase
MLLSGTDAHIAGLGGMAERMNRFPEIFKHSPRYEGYLNLRVAALPEIMQDNGYFAVTSVKWYAKSLEDLGNHNSVVWYGRQWATAATAPNRGAKSYTTEGGIQCPCVVRYPTGTDLQPGSIANTVRVMDILPKVLDLPGLNTLGNNFEAEIVTPFKGKSWGNLLESSNENQVNLYDPMTDIIGWEQFGIAAVRVDHRKALYLPPPRGAGKLGTVRPVDRSSNLAGSHRCKLLEIIAHYETYYQESGMFNSYSMDRPC